jgi:hypothetical protein
MLPEKSQQTQRVARVARRIIGSNMDIPEITTIKWTARVIVSFALKIYVSWYVFFLFNKKDTDMKNGKFFL